MQNRFLLIFLIVFGLSISCDEQNLSRGKKHIISNYDMRDDLNPKRLTIAMWDFSWMYMHYPGGAFEDFDKAADELIERGFNTVRIDAFPLIIGKLDSLHQPVTIAGDSLRNWGPTDKDRQHDIVNELLEFMKITKDKNISVILSSWGFGCNEFPDILNDYTNMEFFWHAWEKTLNILADQDLLDHVLYVDFDQEFPYFSPFNSHLNKLKADPVFEEKNKMEAAGQVELNFDKFDWNSAQLFYENPGTFSTNLPAFTIYIFVDLVLEGSPAYGHPNDGRTRASHLDDAKCNFPKPIQIFGRDQGPGAA